MAAKKRQSDPDIVCCLAEKPYCFDFFKAVELMSRFSGRRDPGRAGSPSEEPVRFSVRPGIGFPASDIDWIENRDNGTPPRMTVNFMGLIGPSGVLPEWYNTHAQNRNYRKDYCFTDFLDMFHHRFISLFFRAWKKYRLVENYQPGGSDPISRILADLAGTCKDGDTDESAFTDYAGKRMIHFCGLVSRCVPTATAIETVVGNAVGAAVRIEQFAERMMPLYEPDRTCLGKRNGTLNQDALCGTHIREVGSFFRVYIGPLSWDRYMAFAPKSKNLALVERLIACLAGIEYEFEIRLIVRGTEIPAIGLGSGQPEPILGRTVMMRRPAVAHHADVIIRQAH